MLHETLYGTVYMNNQMEVLNLSFIVQVNNVFNAFFVIYLPVINASDGRGDQCH